MQNTTSDNTQNINTREGIILLDKHGFIYSISARAKELLDISDIFHGKHYSELFKGCYDKQNAVIEEGQYPGIETLQSGKSQIDEVIGFKRTIHQKMLWAMVSSFAIYDDTNNISCCQLTFIDVSTLYACTLQLNEELSHIDTLVSTIDDIVFELTEEGTILKYWTSVPEQLFIDKNEIIGKSMFQIFPEEYTTAFLEIIQKSLRDKGSYELEYQSPFNHVKEEWFRLKTRYSDTSDKTLTVIITNITNDVAARKQTFIQEQKFNQVFKHSKIGMLLLNLDGYITEYNECFLSMLGYESDFDLSGLHFKEITHPEDVSLSENVADDLIKKGVPVSIVEKRYICKSGQPISCLMTGSMIYGPEQTPLFYLAQIQDLTLFNKNRDELRARQTEINNTNYQLGVRVRQLETFNQMVAHKLRAPASNIMMLIHQLEESKGKSDYHILVKLLKDSSIRLIHVLEKMIELLDYEVFSTKTVGECQIKQIVTDTLNTLSAGVHRHIRFDLREKTIQFSKSFVENIIRNIIAEGMLSINGSEEYCITVQTYKSEGSTFLIFKFESSWIKTQEAEKFQKYANDLFNNNMLNDDYLGIMMIKHQLKSLGGDMIIENKSRSEIVYKVCLPSMEIINTNN